MLAGCVRSEVLLLRPNRVGSSNLKVTSSRRLYAMSAKQGTKKKSVKRKLSDMPGYKERAKKTMEEIQSEINPPKNFIRMFGPNSNFPPPPPEPERTGKYAALFPGEEEVPKETEMLIGGTNC